MSKETPLHHLHAAPAGAMSKRGSVSFDIGEMRLRIEGGDDEQKRDLVRRAVHVWNQHEGIPTSVLEAGAVRAFYDAVQALLNLAFAESIDFAALLAAARTVESRWGGITIELTKDGRRAECPCTESAS